MRTFYQWLLRLYPAEFRRQFADEMLVVYGDASAAAARRGFGSGVCFVVHEFTGMVWGAMAEHMRSISGLDSLSRRIAMISKRPRFRFPVVAIALMVFSFAGIVFAIHNARAVAFSLAGQTYIRHGQLYTYHPEGLSFMQTFGFAFGVTLAVAIGVWAVLHTLHRSGVHRLEEAQTWPRE